MHRFQVDDEQADAILETKLYRLARMEIDAILLELGEKERLAAELRLLLADEPARWSLIRSELSEVREAFGDARRSVVAGPDEVLSYSAEDYIVSEDVFVIVTRDGWVKRQRSYSDLQSIRTRDGDDVGWVLAGSTRASVGFFTNFGRAYTVRISELPSTTGYGDPVQKLFDFSDKERVIGVVCFDERVLPEPMEPLPDSPSLFGDDDEPPGESAAEGPFLVSVSRQGQVVRIAADSYAEPSTRAGRLYMRLDKDDEALGVEVAAGDENVCLASRESYVLIFPLNQVSLFKGVAKGVRAMRLGAGDRVIGFTLSGRARDGLVVETSRGRREIVRTTKFEVSNRGNRGRQIIRRGTLARVIHEPIEIRLNGRN
jgi:DNA gyrase subunit A